MNAAVILAPSNQLRLLIVLRLIGEMFSRKTFTREIRHVFVFVFSLFFLIDRTTMTALIEKDHSSSTTMTIFKSFIKWMTCANTGPARVSCEKIRFPTPTDPCPIGVKRLA